MGLYSTFQMNARTVFAAAVMTSSAVAVQRETETTAEQTKRAADGCSSLLTTEVSGSARSVCKYLKPSGVKVLTSAYNLQNKCG